MRVVAEHPNGVCGSGATLVVSDQLINIASILHSHPPSPPDLAVAFLFRLRSRGRNYSDAHACPCAGHKALVLGPCSILL